MRAKRVLTLQEAVQLIEESEDNDEHEIAMMPPDDQTVTDDEHIGKAFYFITYKYDNTIYLVGCIRTHFEFFCIFCI